MQPAPQLLVRAVQKQRLRMAERGCPAAQERATPTVSTECKLLLKGNFLEAVILTGTNFAVAEWELSHAASIQGWSKAR